jgi:hypothetical protein
LGGRGRQISEFEANLVYRVSSRTARDTQRNPVSKNKKKKKKEKKKPKPKPLPPPPKRSGHLFWNRSYSYG